jgi:hypothetical protein
MSLRDRKRRKGKEGADVGNAKVCGKYFTAEPSKKNTDKVVHAYVLERQKRERKKQ